MRENNTCPNQGWQQMPTEQLDQILQAELKKEYPNEEVVLPILRILEEREKDIPVEETPEVLEIERKFRKHKTSSKQSGNRRRWIAGIAAAAAVVCLVVMTISPIAQAESILDVLFRWTSSIFEFFTPEQDTTNPPVEIVYETDNPGLQQLYNEVTELGVTELVVPMWLPEGFTLSELRSFPMRGGNKLYAKFSNCSSDISITYRISTDITTKFEKEEIAVEVFEAGDVSHFIMENEEKLSVTWTVEGVECSILTDIDKKDVYKTIKSIYRSELS